MCSIFDAFSQTHEDCEELNIPNHLNIFGELLLSYAPHLSIDDSCIRLFTAKGLFFRPSPSRLSPGRHTVFVLMNELDNA